MTLVIHADSEVERALADRAAREGLPLFSPSTPNLVLRMLFDLDPQTAAATPPVGTMDHAAPSAAAELKTEVQEKDKSLGDLVLDGKAILERVKSAPSEARPVAVEDAVPVQGVNGRTHKRIGPRLLREHGLNCKKGYFSKTGIPYQKPDSFPAVFFDTNGYFIVDDEESMRSNPYINVGKKVSIPRGIYSIPGYMRCQHEHS